MCIISGILAAATALGTALVSTLGVGGTIGAFAGAGLGLTSAAISTTTSLVGAYQQNKAVEDQYQQEVNMARQKAAYDQQRQNEETHERLLQNAQEARDSSLESMRTRSNTEAAMSALNIAGNSGQREIGVADVTQIRREGAYAENEDVMGVQHLMSQLGINQQYEWDTTAARNRAKSNWKDVQGMALKGYLYDVPMAGLQGTLNGASLGKSLFGGGGGGGGSGYQMPSFSQSVAGAPGTAYGVATPATNKIGGSSSYLSGGAFGMALA